MKYDARKISTEEQHLIRKLAVQRVFAGESAAEVTRFKLGQCAEKKWRKLCGFDYLSKVVTGVKFKNGIEVIADDLAAA